MIIAVDPGPKESAYVIIDGDSIAEFGKVENMQLMDILSDLSEPGNSLAIEMIASYGMPVGREVFETCVWIGRFIETFKGPYRYIYRKDVKMHLCHSMNANDASIRRALLDRFGPQGTKKHPGKTYGISKDVWSALAVGITALENPE